MPIFDLFGMGKSKAKEEVPLEAEEAPQKEEPAPAPPSENPGGGRSKKFWGALLAADALIFLLCLGFTGFTL